MKRLPDIKKINRVVVRGTNWVGDAAMSVPALRELRRILPEAHITLCTRPFASGIFADADFLDDILLFEREKSGVKTVFKQAKIWRKREFNLAILFQNAFQAALLARLGKAKHRIGYRTDARSFLLTNALTVPEWKNNRHEVFYYLNIVAELETLLRGATDVWKHEPDIGLRVSETRKDAAREILRSNGVDSSKKIVALCAGSINSRAKRWQASSYAELADLIHARLNADIVLIGSPDELEVSKEVYALAKFKPILLTGKTSLAEAVAVLSIVDLLVTNDTGPAHIAPALSTKTIVIFGPTIPDTTRPFSNLAQIIRKPPACAPCMLRDCPIDHRCMTAISATEVFDEVTKVLNVNG
ncbi:MAG: lipopolysaccharide heptosyltransferase II [Pyrinomonadaceae bacterium]|nr:lipopolysaccharide heptosyltransferase II [Pyrinomonadaceae bacterium]